MSTAEGRRGGPETSAPAFRLRIVSSDLPGLTGREIPSADMPLTIGRTADCWVVLKDNRISRQHARIEADAAGFRLLDLDSANGIFVVDKRVRELRLSHGLQFRIAGTVFEFVAPSVRPPAPAAPPPRPPAPARAAADDRFAETVITPRPPAPPAAASAPAPARATPAFVVRVISSKRMPAGKEWKVATGRASLGRGEDCTIVLDDDSASRKHAVIEASLTPGQLRLADTGSSNGTWIGDRRVKDETIAVGQRFRIGDTFLECHPPAVRHEGTMVMEGLGDLLVKEAAGYLGTAGEAITIGGSQVILLDDPRQAYYILSGKVEVFTVTVKDGKPLGARNHFLTLSPGEGFFGVDPKHLMDSGLIATGKGGTQIRRIPRAELGRLAGSNPEMAKVVAGLVDAWVGGLSARLTRDIFPRPQADVLLVRDKATELEKGKKARSEDGVLWVDIAAGRFLFISMTTLMPAARRVRFPLTPQTWLELTGDLSDTGTTDRAKSPSRESDSSGAPKVETLRGVTTQEMMAEGGPVWKGIDLFHEVLCECEFINKRLAVVDEYQRLQSKARQSERALDAGYDAIGAVLAGKTPAGLESAVTSVDVEPVLEACRLVAGALGIRVRAPGEKAKEKAFDDHLASIASASRFRTRRIALRGEWWTNDGGPLLAQTEAGAPVALLPTGPRSYEYVDPVAKVRKKVTSEVAASLGLFAHTLYRPLPPGQPALRDLMGFAIAGLGSDLRTILAMGVVTGMLGMIGPFLTGQMIDFAIPQGDRGLILQLGFGMLMAALATAAFKITQSIAVVRVESKVDYTLQAALWDRLLDLPPNFFRTYGSGDLADRAAGINAIRGLVAKAGVGAVLGALSSLGYVFVMLKTSGKLMVAALIITFILVGFTTACNYFQLRYQRQEIAIRGGISGLVLQLIGGVAKLRVGAAENHAFRVWAQRFSEQKRVAFSVGQVQNVSQTFSQVFPPLSSLAMFATIAFLMASAKPGDELSLSTGSFIAFNTAFATFMAAMQALADSSLSLLRAVPIYERIKPILETPPETDESRADPGKLRGAIAVSHVHFRYNEDSGWILRDVSFSIRPGEFVAFVGPSGCGKSTMMRLLLGFEKPGMGSIYYDGQDFSSLDARLVRQQLGVVLQESRVLPTDLFRNIVGTAQRTMDEAWEAAEMAGLAEDIRQMPMGMHTVVSEGGGTFSGGQRQRLLIARALVNKPKIIFCDEATSALDNKTQAVVTQSMDRMEATRIVIAHRLTTVANADRIFYFDGGQIREEGTYDELMAKDGLFAALAKRQIA
jgi:NHLM bacteriocin system ABC transporter ATP-binding protein